MTTTDPFAAVQVPQAPVAPQVRVVGPTIPAQPVDPFASAQDMADPFATNSDYRGDFIPSPGIEVLQGRLVVMIPRKLDPAAPDPNNPGKTRELYTVDLTVLTGGKLEYLYKQKGDPEAGTQDEWKTWTVEDISPAQPFTITGYWVPQGAIVGRLKRAHRDGRPFLGTVAMVPTKDQRDKGITAAQVQSEFQAWVQRGKNGARPRYSWALPDPDAAGRQAAITWWAGVKDSIDPITPASN